MVGSLEELVDLFEKTGNTLYKIICRHLTNNKQLF